MSTVADKLAKKSTSKSSAKQVRLRLVYVDFWSAVKLSFLAAVELAIVTMVTFLLMYLVVQATGLIGMADELLSSLNDGKSSLNDILGLPQVMAFAAVVAIDAEIDAQHIEFRRRRCRDPQPDRRDGAWRRRGGHLQPGREGNGRVAGWIHLQLGTVAERGLPVDS